MLFETIYNKASFCREFEKEVYSQIQQKNIKIPVYLSAGQEYIPATIASYLNEKQILNRQVFIQHRGHSSYLSFGGDTRHLIDELLGKPSAVVSLAGLFFAPTVSAPQIQ